MKPYEYVQLGCIVALIALIPFTGFISYTMGVNNGKIELCASNDAYLVDDMYGERCIDKDFYNSLQESQERPINIYEDLTQ